MTPSLATAFHPQEETHYQVYDPEKGRLTGVWFEGRWVDAFTLSVELEPSHTMDVPPDPDGALETRGPAELEAAH